MSRLVRWRSTCVQRSTSYLALDLGVESRTPAGQLIIGVCSSFKQDERENNRDKNLAGIKLAKQLEQPAGRNAEKVAKALKKGLSMVEIVTLMRISRASVKRYRHEWRAIAAQQE